MGQHASRPAVQTAPLVKPQRFLPPVAAQAMAGPQQPSSSAMEERKPSRPAEAKEEGKPPQERTVVPPRE